MKLSIDTEKQELEVLEAASFLEIKMFLEQLEGGIGYTVVSTKAPMFPFAIGGVMESTPGNDLDEGPY